MDKLLFIDNMPLNTRRFYNDINIFYHINTYSFPYEHTHEDYWEFTIVTQGSLINDCNGEKTVMKANTLFISTPNDVHSLQVYGESYMEYINIMIKEEYLNKTLNALSPDFSQKISQFKQTNLSGQTTQQIELILHNIALAKDKNFVRYKELMLQVYLIIINNLYPIIYNQSNSVLPDWAERLDTLLSSTNTLAFSVNDLCKELGYSRTHLDRLFKSYYGISPKEYLTRQKLHYALNLLHSSDLSIITIAHKIGFSSLGQFNTVFKQHYKVTPTQMRKLGKTRH